MSGGLGQGVRKASAMAPITSTFELRNGGGWSAGAAAFLATADGIGQFNCHAAALRRVYLIEHVP